MLSFPNQTYAIDEKLLTFPTFRWKVTKKIRPVSNEETSLISYESFYGIVRNFTIASILFQPCSCLIFQHKNWFSLLDSKKADNYHKSPQKNSIQNYMEETFKYCRILN